MAGLQYSPENLCLVPNFAGTRSYFSPGWVYNRPPNYWEGFRLYYIHNIAPVGYVLDCIALTLTCSLFILTAYF
jgi:hypothetical protein